MTATEGVSRVANVMIPASDQDGMLRLYTETLALG
jgi:hypothetical protein